MANDDVAKNVTSPAPPPIQGVYEYSSSKNFDAYLTELGVSYILRKLAALASPTVTISRNACSDTNSEGSDCKEWTISTSTMFRSHQVSFNLGEPVTDTTMDGRNVQMTVTQEAADNSDAAADGKGGAAPSLTVWKEVQVGLDSNWNVDTTKYGKTTRLVRTFLTDKMTVDLLCGNVSSSSIFHRKMS